MAGALLTRNRIAAVLIAALAVVAATGLFVFFASRPVVAESLTVEAGGPFPDVSEFIVRGGGEAPYLSGMPSDSSVPGVYGITVVIDEKGYASSIIVRDTVPPMARVVDITAWTGEILSPEDFVRDITDATEVTVTFEAAPDMSVPGARKVAVLLTDAGMNVTRLVSELRVYAVEDKVDVRPDTDKNAITVFSFVKNVPAGDMGLFMLITDLSMIDFDVPGRREVVVTLGGRARQGVLDVFDVTPPTATPTHIHKFVGDRLDPNDFVTDITDQTPVTVSFAAGPDNTAEGERAVDILLTDAYGNTAALTALLTLIHDTEPPVISGTLDKTIFTGDTIAYRAGVTVTDNRDAEVALKIDSDAVDPKKEGVYPVIYSATDSSGNTATVQGTVTVFDVTRKQVYEMADGILAKITNASMSLYNKAQAIYSWVLSNVSYVSTSIKDDTMLAAYRGLKDKRGDCFVFASVAELLLTRAEIDNIMLQRIPGQRATHYWSIINIGDGWYHFDTTPHQSGGSGFMLTESQALELAKKRSSTYYTYDKSLYPEVTP